MRGTVDAQVVFLTDAKSLLEATKARKLPHLQKALNTCPIWGQSSSFWSQIWSPWFVKLQLKQQNGLDDAWEITTLLWTHFRENLTVVIGNKYQIYYIGDWNMPGDAGIYASNIIKLFYYSSRPCQKTVRTYYGRELNAAVKRDYYSCTWKKVWARSHQKSVYILSCVAMYANR